MKFANAKLDRLAATVCIKFLDCFEFKYIIYNILELNGG